MSYQLKSDVQELIGELVRKMCKFENDAKFKEVHKKCCKELSMAPSYFANANDIERSISGLCDKFVYHSLADQASDLRQLADNYLKGSIGNYDLQNRLNVVQFLICTSVKPTERAIGCRAASLRRDADDDIADWAAYLLPDELKWQPPPDESDESWSDSSREEEDDVIDAGRVQASTTYEAVAIAPSPMSASAAFDALLATNWTNNEPIRVIPDVTHPSKRAGLLYEEQMSRITGGLLPPLNIVPEHFVVREIIWQLLAPHTGVAYSCDGGAFAARDDVTIASVTQPHLHAFLRNFVAYLEAFRRIRAFRSEVVAHDRYDVPQSYVVYSLAEMRIVGGLYAEILDMETFAKRHRSYTLPALWMDVSEKLRAAKVLARLHANCLLDAMRNDNRSCAINLLTQLRKSLFAPYDKLEQDICLTLYLETLHVYVAIIDGWLTQCTSHDHAGEFVVDLSHANQLEAIGADCRDDELLRTIRDEIKPMMGSAYLCNLMDSSLLTYDFATSLYDEFVARMLTRIARHFGTELTPDVEAVVETEETIEENPMMAHVDTSDGFLMAMFSDLFELQRMPKKRRQRKRTLYEKISRLTTGRFSCYDWASDTLLQLVRERFGAYGERAKDTILRKYNLHGHIEILQSVCLFQDNALFALYSKLFAKINSGKADDVDSMGLTYEMQDILRDRHGDAIDEYALLLKQNATHCKDPLQFTAMLTVAYRPRWPISVVITADDHVMKYEEIYRFAVRLQWAIHSLNEMGIKNTFVKRCLNLRVGRRVLRQLNVINFELLHAFNRVRHFLFGYAFPVGASEFGDALRSATDFDELKAAHAQYIRDVHERCVRFGGDTQTYGFAMLLHMVKKMQLLYKKPEKLHMLQLMQTSLRKCCANLEAAMFVKY